MPSEITSLLLQSPEQTGSFAERIAVLLEPGDCLLLEGQIGAGKTHFARHLIQSLQSEPEDVPSPTYTLVQTYQSRRGEIWHADLYRLGSVDEIEELGLNDAFETAICLIEWPERLGALAPESALRLRFSTTPDNPNARLLELTSNDPKWAKLETVFDDV